MSRTSMAGLEQAELVIRALIQHKTTESEVQSVHPYLTDLLKAAKRGTLPNRTSFRQMLELDPGLDQSKVFRFVVNYNLHRHEMCETNQVDSEDLERSLPLKEFPINGVGHVEYEAYPFCLNRGISEEDVLRYIAELDVANPWKVAFVEHLIHAAPNMRSTKNKNTLVGLGSLGKVPGQDPASIYVAELYASARRQLLSSQMRGYYGPGVWFLAVRRVKK